jgi:hypothetical protein
MTKGILVGCDHNQEWMLEWWWSHYSQHNCYPVGFVDFGMSAEAKKWCQNKGHWISLNGPKDFVYPQSLISRELVDEWEKIYGKELWKGREKWFYKPFALQETPFDETIWIDLDCEVTGPLAPLFNKVHVHSKMALARDTGPSTQEEGYNTGVIAYHRTSPLLTLWTELSFLHNDRFLGDQDALSFLIHSENIEVAELPSKYNWVVREGINFEAIILHWAGKWGKDVISRSLRNCES